MSAKRKQRRIISARCSINPIYVDGRDRGIFPVESEPQKQTGGNRPSKGDERQKEAAPNHFRTLLDQSDLSRVSLGFLQTVILGGIMLRVHILPQPADDAHKPDVDRENQQRSCGNEESGSKERLKQASDVGHGGAFRSASAFSCGEF